MENCRTCEFFNTNEKEQFGECTNPKVFDANNKNTLVRAGGSEGDGDYFHVSPDFGCIAHETKKEIIEKIKTEMPNTATFLEI